MTRDCPVSNALMVAVGLLPRRSSKTFSSSESDASTCSPMYPAATMASGPSRSGICEVTKDIGLGDVSFEKLSIRSIKSPISGTARIPAPDARAAEKTVLSIDDRNPEPSITSRTESTAFANEFVT